MLLKNHESLLEVIVRFRKKYNKLTTNLESKELEFFCLEAKFEDLLEQHQCTVSTVNKLRATLNRVNEASVAIETNENSFKPSRGLRGLVMVPF